MRSAEELRSNLAEVVLLVRSRRATSRRTLADVMRLSPSTVGFYVDQLMESGHLRESGLDQGRMGRPKRALDTVAAAGWFAGIEFTAARVQGVRVDFSGIRTASMLRPLAAGANTHTVMAEIKKLIEAMARNASSPLLGIGLGAPGVVDPRRGVGVDYAFLPDWKEVPAVDQLRKRFKVPVTLENNLRAIALAERWFGGAQEQADYLILGPRSGFGIAIVHGGKLMDGVHHAAGEVGHWPWPDAASGTLLHDHLSAPAVWRKLSGASQRAKLPADLPAALWKHADSTGSAWRNLVEEFAHFMACLQLVLDIPHCFLHGPLTALGVRFCEEVSATLPKIAPHLQSRPLSLHPSALGDDAGALGAASLAMEAWGRDGAME